MLDLLGHLKCYAIGMRKWNNLVIYPPVNYHVLGGDWCWGIISNGIGKILNVNPNNGNSRYTDMFGVLKLLFVLLSCLLIQ